MKQCHVPEQGSGVSEVDAAVHAVRLTLSEFVYGDGGIERGALVQAERVCKLVHGRDRVDAIKGALVAAADVRDSVSECSSKRAAC